MHNMRLIVFTKEEQLHQIICYEHDCLTFNKNIFVYIYEVSIDRARDYVS